MKPIFYCLLLTIIVSCGNEKIVQLPEIQHSDISKIDDVSAAYLFYDETMPDSVELNRKNLISTTNWLVNVDKRLTLGQAIPKIMYIQAKKRDAQMHKNENAKNYFTCNNISIKNLGFIEFTNVYYHENGFNTYLEKNKANQVISIKVNSPDSIIMSFMFDGTTLSHSSNYTKLLEHLKTNLINEGNAIIILELNQKLSFQDYITLKSLLSKINLKNVSIANDEFVFN
ncbi:hypothetical protein [Yeosuana marina]|uniref:hypothetical protein n=1 Tax=Yeosuana marina TaxID=1565536 RepID=UPI00141E72C3|nr:hypothetical protein [Yeosuana marina]